VSTDDREAYRKAFSAAQKRFERNGRKITHCRYRDGVLEVSTDEMVARLAETVEECREEALTSGLDVRPQAKAKRGLVQGSLL
jgi:hypothetical protein